MTSGTPRIGDELAAGRALSELARRLVPAAAEDIEHVTHKPAHLRG
jgi:Rv2632c-like